MRTIFLLQVREFVSRYSIQIENPCTFLAQDKVKSFSAQSPQLLLENTEKVIYFLLWLNHCLCAGFLNFQLLATEMDFYPKGNLNLGQQSVISPNFKRILFSRCSMSEIELSL